MTVRARGTLRLAHGDTTRSWWTRRTQDRVETDRQRDYLKRYLVIIKATARAEGHFPNRPVSWPFFKSDMGVEYRSAVHRSCDGRIPLLL